MCFRLLDLQFAGLFGLGLSGFMPFGAQRLWTLKVFKSTKNMGFPKIRATFLGSPKYGV